MNKLIEDYRKMAKARCDAYTRHIRAADNEWILEEYDEWMSEVNTAHYISFKNDVISKADYQQIVGQVAEYFGELGKRIEAYERQFVHFQKCDSD